MGIAPYRHSYQRARKACGAQAAGYVANPACHLTDQGGAPDPADLAWCVRRCWRVIYYSARQAAGQPLWLGADDFEALMTDLLFALGSAFEPVQPIRPPKSAVQERGAADVRKDRVSQPSCRVFHTPVFDDLGWTD